MKKIWLFSAFLFFSLGIYSQTKSYKRGVAYGYHSVKDMQNFSPNISWWYNWAAQPDYAIRSTYQNYDVDFTPMAWNNVGISGVSSWADKDSLIKYILGFNEPNFKAQANMTPTQAAAAWPALQKIAVKHDLKIVGPAVNYCDNCVTENGITYTNPFKYLDDFFTACDTCQVDFIGLHWYGGGNSIMNYVRDARKYKKQIWVTEFAAWDNSVTNAKDQIKYLAGTVNFLERDPDIYRYSWFIGRRQTGQTTHPYIDLYGANGMLTELGQMYMDIPIYDPEMKFEIPGRIETEEYYLMSGLFSEPASDTDGFLNIGWTDINDWAEYKIVVDKSGTYKLNARVAGTGQGIIHFLVDNQLKAQINTPNTGGWQNWRTVSKDIELEAGEHILKMLVKAANFNINWIEISNTTAVKNEIEILETEVYPNPVTNGIVNVVLHKAQSGGEFSCRLFDIYGKQVFTKNVNVNRALFQLNLNETIRLPAGVYYLNISGDKSMANKLIVVQ
ncbi:MAG TPA: glycosyl hydrolase [Draconibacterium sp.]|nr:glycosyl hydrolase [Draconibacterium sp.]